MKNFKKLIKESYLGNPLNENKLPSGFHSQEDVNQFFLDTVESGDVVTYKGKDHTVQRIEDDDLGVRVYIRPNEKSYYGGRKDTFWVKPEDLESKEESDKGYDWLKNPSVKDQEYLRQKYESWNKMHPNDQIDIEKALKGIYENKFDIAAKDEYGKPFAELSIAQKQELISYMNRETEKEFETDYTSRRKGELDDKYDGMTDYQRGRMDEGKYNFVDKSEARINELDMNDPVLIKTRASQMKRDKIEADEKDKKSYLDKKYGASHSDKLFAEIDLKNELQNLEDEREDVLMRIEDIGVETEQTAEPEGGPIADELGRRLMAAEKELRALDSKIIDVKDELGYFGDVYESDLDEGTCGYTPDGEPRSKPASPDLNENEIPLWLTDNREFEKAVIVSTSYNDFEKRVYHILGPKYFKLALTQQPGVFKDYYDSIRVTRPNLEEESDTGVGGGAKQAIGLDIDDAHSGDAALDDEVNKMGYNESKGFNFKQMVKEALTPNNLK